MELCDRELSYIYHPLMRPCFHRVRSWEKERKNPPRVSRCEGIPVSTYDLSGSGLAGAAGKRIVFLSDLHYQGSSKCRKKAAALSRIVRDLAPDLLLLGGDMVADAHSLEEVPEVLAGLSASAPAAYAVPGNWEQGKLWMSAGQWEEFYHRGGVELLCNRRIEGQWFDLFGCEDPACGHPHPPPPWRSGKLRLLLAHRPDAVVAMDQRNGFFHLALAGHHHGGQLRLPFVGALYVPGHYRDRLSQGMLKHRRHDARMIISRGLGECTFPWRFNCRREVVLVTL